MPLLAELANACRLDEPRNLFCLVEFGDHGIIVGYTSGKGYWSVKEQCARVLERGQSRIVLFNDPQRGVNKDGEERMAEYFDGAYTKHGNGTEHITIFTAASPCSRVCAPTLHALAERWRGRIKTWTIAYHKPYESDKDEEFGGVTGSMALLNDTGIEGVQLNCFVLHTGFVDEASVHGRRRK